MKTQLITAVLLAGATLLSAQEIKTTTVRIKKIENVNGKETVKDTTYTLNGPVNVNTLEPGSAGGENHITIFTDQVSGDSPSLQELNDEKTTTAMIDEQVAKALKGLGVDSSAVEKTYNLNAGSKNQSIRVVIVKHSVLTDLSEEEQKRVCKKINPVNNQLPVASLSLLQEPGNSKTTLSFSLSGKGNTAVTLLNGEGQILYTEKLSNFTGDYRKDLDLSRYAKGIYFIRIEQGGQGLMKKVIVE